MAGDIVHSNAITPMNDISKGQETLSASKSIKNSSEGAPKPVIPDNLDEIIALNAFSAIALSLTFLLMFLILRKKFKWVYYPNTASFGEHHPLLPEGRTGLSSWKWVKYTLFLPDTQLLTLVGMDAFVLIMVLKMLFWIFFILSALASVLLLPVYASGTYGARDSTTATQIYSRLSISHLATGSAWLWMPAFTVWVFSLVFLYGLVLFYSAYVHLRQAYIASPASLTSVSDLITFYRVTGSLEKSYAMLDIQSRTLLVQGLDKRRFQTEEAVTAFFDQCSVGLVMETVFIRDHPTLRKLIRDRNTILRQLESACMQLTHAALTAAANDQLILDSVGKDISISVDTSDIQSTDKTSSPNEQIIGLLKALGAGQSLPIALPPLTPARKRALLLAAFECSFLSAYRPSIKKSFWKRMFSKKNSGKSAHSSDPIMDNDAKKTSDIESGDMTIVREEEFGTDLIANLGRQLVSIDELIENERLAIFNHSRMLLVENEQEAETQAHQIASLQLPKRALVNDTRLLLVNAASSTPPSQMESSFLESSNSLNNAVSYGGVIEPSQSYPGPTLNVVVDSESIADSSHSSGEHTIFVGGISSKSSSKNLSETWLPGLAADNAVFFSHSLLSEALQDARLAMPGQTRAAFVTFRESTSASIMSQVLVDGTPFSCRTTPAPRPNEILWGNITLPASLKALRSWTGTAAIILLNLTWFIPVTFVNSLNQINRIAQAFPGLGWVLRLPRSVQTLIEGILAPLLLNVLLVVIPYALEAISRYEGAPSKTLLQRSLIRKYLAFLYLQTFFVSFLSGSIFSALVPFMKGDISSVVTEIRQMLVPKSSFFFNLVTLKIAYDLFLTLANPVRILFFFSGSNVVVVDKKTPRERHESQAPDSVNYGVLLPLLLFSVPLILTYAVITPLMLGIGTIYYGTAYFVYRHNFLYAARSPSESGGFFLYDLVLFLLVGLGTFQGMTAIQLSFQGAHLQALVIMPTFLATFGVWRLITRITQTASSHVPAGGRPDLAPAAEYPIYKRSIPRLHARDALSLGAKLGGRSTLDLIAILISRQKLFLAEAELAWGHSNSLNNGNISQSVVNSQSNNIPNTHNQNGNQDGASHSASQWNSELLRPTPSSEAVTINECLSKLQPQSQPQSQSHTPSTDSGSLRDTIEWYMSNPYRNPTLFKKLNSIYLPRSFFQLVQVILIATNSKEITTIATNLAGGDGPSDFDDELTSKNEYDNIEDINNGISPVNGFLYEDEENEMMMNFSSASVAFDAPELSASGRRRFSHTFDKYFPKDKTLSKVKSDNAQSEDAQPDPNSEIVTGSDKAQPPSLSFTSSDGVVSSMTFMSTDDPIPPPVIKLSK